MFFFFVCVCFVVVVFFWRKVNLLFDHCSGIVFLEYKKFGKIFMGFFFFLENNTEIL